MATDYILTEQKEIKQRLDDIESFLRKVHKDLYEKKDEDTPER